MGFDPHAKRHYCLLKAPTNLELSVDLQEPPCDTDNRYCRKQGRETHVDENLTEGYRNED